MRRKAYIGCTKKSTREAFTSPETPTSKTHGDKYTFVWGPFSSLKIADWVAEHAPGNPHFVNVAAAERIYRSYHR